MKKKKKTVGRPPEYTTEEKLQEKINEYFEKGVPIRKVIIGNGANKSVAEVPVPTITGLVLYLGFCDRKAFYDYEKKPEFSYTIKKARAAIERHYEELLQTGMPTGAIFALKNFDWKDKSDIVLDIPENLLDKLKDLHGPELIKQVNAIINGNKPKP